MLTDELDVMARLCADPLLEPHEAAVGVLLADADEPTDGAAGEPTGRALPADAESAFRRLLAGLPLPDGDDGFGEVW